jgi:[histone H3]-lysine4 N-trimethyltransferase ASH1L
MVGMMCHCRGLLIKCFDNSCLNRATCTECTEECGSGCQNQRIRNQTDKSQVLELFKAQSKGMGVRTTEIIQEGEFIIEFVGEVIPAEKFQERMRTVYANDIHHYSIQLSSRSSGNFVIDAHRKGNYSEFSLYLS